MDSKQKLPWLMRTEQQTVEVVELYRSSDRAIRDIANELGIAPESLRRRIGQHDVDAGKSDAASSAERYELSELREGAYGNGIASHRYPGRSRCQWKPAWNSAPLSIWIHTERQAFKDVIGELDRSLLIDAVVEPQHPYTGAIVDGGELVVALARRP